MSRGASKVVFTELAPLNVKIIKTNLELSGFSENARILRGDVFKLMRKMGEANEQFDIILADPPFRGCYRERIVREVDENALLQSDGLLMVEHESHDTDNTQGGIRMIKQRQFGQCIVSIYQ
jgi:16S rRNA G966 N2-methylase RsmD